MTAPRDPVAELVDEWLTIRLGTLASFRETVERHLRPLLDDKARLDFLESLRGSWPGWYLCQYKNHDGKDGACLDVEIEMRGELSPGDGYAPTVRAALDAARKQEG